MIFCCQGWERKLRGRFLFIVKDAKRDSWEGSFIATKDAERDSGKGSFFATKDAERGSWEGSFLLPRMGKEAPVEVHVRYVREEAAMQEVIKLVKATGEDTKLLYGLQVRSFMPLYEKYHDDDTSPAKESEERLFHKIEDANSDFYLVYMEKKPVGGVRVSHHHGKTAVENVEWISPIFIIPEYQNRGIAQLVIRRLFELYPKTITWRLGTIKQEQRNCHLYEKLGFQKVGTEQIVNDKMTLIVYEKTCVSPRRFRREDAEEVSKLIIRNLLEVNSKDYGREAMQKLADGYHGAKVISIADSAHMYVLEWNGQIVGVGAISSYFGSETESMLLSIFVLPEHHGKGIGRTIMNILESDEWYNRAERIEIQASITGVEFYRRFGYDYKNGVKELNEEWLYCLEKFK